MSEQTTTTTTTNDDHDNTNATATNAVKGDPSTTAVPPSGITDEERSAIASMSYEEARDRLIHVVQALEAGGLNLDQSMRQWELGEALANRAQALLDQVRSKLDAAQAQQQSTADTAGTQSNLD